MAFAREQAECPFCSSTRFAVKLFVNDMPQTNSPSEVGKRLTLICTGCDKEVFEVIITKGKQVSAVGVSVCEQCETDSRNAAGGKWRDEDIPRTTYPVGTEHCPRCNSQLEARWWRGSGYEI